PTAEVVAGKNAVMVTTRAMAAFVHNKVDAIHGSGSKPMDFCPTLAVTVPVPAACSSRIDMGGVFTARAEGARQGVEFTIVYSAHVNDVAPSLLTKAQQDLLKRSEEHTSELQSRFDLVCRLLLEKKKNKKKYTKYNTQ